ncbi:MAG: hypothetical protein DRJ65_10135 [Acidobacteria bacterium]|nr:MAG: hypothetical protein DRJ65_10135 [Acidobacteriota bacterium]
MRPIQIHRLHHSTHVQQLAITPAEEKLVVRPNPSTPLAADCIDPGFERHRFATLTWIEQKEVALVRTLARSPEYDLGPAPGEKDRVKAITLAQAFQSLHRPPCLPAALPLGSSGPRLLTLSGSHCHETDRLVRIDPADADLNRVLETGKNHQLGC